MSEFFSPFCPDKQTRTAWLEQLRYLSAHDLPAARRAALLDILWNEPYITRQGLMARVRYLLHLDCWESTPQATFRRDLAAVRTELKVRGFHLLYGRCKLKRGYYLEGRTQLDGHLKQMMEFAMREVDARQIQIYRQLEPGYRVWQAARLSDWLRQANQFRMQQNSSSTAKEKIYEPTSKDTSI